MVEPEGEPLVVGKARGPIVIVLRQRYVNYTTPLSVSISTRALTSIIAQSAIVLHLLLLCTNHAPRITTLFVYFCILYSFSFDDRRELALDGSFGGIIASHRDRFSAKHATRSSTSGKSL